MATLKINLVSKKISQISKTNTLISKLKLASEIILGVFILGVLGFFGYFFANNIRANNLESEVMGVTQLVAERSQLEYEYKRFQDILVVSEEVLDTRRNFQEILRNVYLAFPDDVLISGVSFVDNVIIVSVTGQGVASFSNALESVRAFEGEGDIFDEVAMVNVRRTGEGVYTFTLQMSLAEEI